MDSLVSRHITIKSPAEQEKMRVAGRLAAEVLDMIGEHVKPGVTTEHIDRLVFDFAMDRRAVPATLMYRGYRKSTCTSINHVVCHGIPNEKPLKDGDVLNIDVTVIKDGYHGDTSKMFMVGKVPEWAQRLAQVNDGLGYIIQSFESHTDGRAGVRRALRDGRRRTLRRHCARRRLRRADVRADVFDLIVGQCCDAAVGLDGGFELAHAVGGRHRSGAAHLSLHR